ncbi:MAG: hypothetical protein AAFX94_04435, partial [Myxococcota bacterium]
MKLITSLFCAGLVAALTGCDDDEPLADATNDVNDVDIMDEQEQEEEATEPPSEPTCIAPEDAFPITSGLTPGATTGPFYASVSPFEYADRARSHVHSADFFGSMSAPEENSVSSRTMTGTYEFPYNVATRDRDELFVYGGDPVSGITPYVAKISIGTGEQVWRTEIPYGEGQFSWPGLAAIHGNGDVYAVHSSSLIRIDPLSGEIRGSVELPAPEGRSTANMAYNGFNVSSTGLLVLKSLGRPEGCELQGFDALSECVTEETPAPPSLFSLLDPETLEVEDSLEFDSNVFGRLAIATFDEREFIYIVAETELTRIEIKDGTLVLDESWSYADFTKDGQSSPTAAVVMDDWVVFQMNGSPAQTPMTVHAVSQADSSVFATADPFGPGGAGISFVLSSLTADPATLRV